MVAASSRYLRYILFAFFGVFVVYFLSSSSIPTSISKPSGYFNNHGSSPESAVDIPPVEKNPSNPLHISPEQSAKEHATPKSSETPKAEQPAVEKKPAAEIKPDVGSSPAPVKSLPEASIAPGDRMNATFVTLARNGDLWELAKSIRHMESRFNHKYHYDWVFLNNEPFDDEFKKFTTMLVSGKTHYGLIPKDHWSYPEFIDQEKAAAVRLDMKNRGIIYGDSESYRHMCRYESGFFFRHELMLNYEWYWRVEPSIELFCNIDFDPFKFMADNKKKYSFVLSLYEYVETIPTLWDSVKAFIKRHPEHIAKDNALAWVSEDGGDTYNHCHFWSNFEIGNLNWLRSQAYLDYFNYLDRDGGFFYERWGDAPVHSIAAALMLQKEEIHFFNEIAYYHVPFTHCPTGSDYRLKHQCHCDPKQNFDWKSYSCTTKWHDLNGLAKPAGWEEESH